MPRSFSAVLCAIAAALLCCVNGCDSDPGPAVSAGSEKEPDPDPGADSSRPNVLFIFVDDLNDWVGFLGGHPQTRTPALDRLASRSTVFERAYANATSCNPSRVSLLTGRHPASTGVYFNNQPFRLAMPDAVTLPQHFRASGYEAVGFGKIFHPPNDPSQSSESWDRIDRMELLAPIPHAPPMVSQPHGESSELVDWAGIDAPPEKFEEFEIARAGVEFLSEAHQRPFFLAIGFHWPHLPWYQPRTFLDRHPTAQVELPPYREGDLEDLPHEGRRRVPDGGKFFESLRTAGKWKEAVGAYLGCVSAVDDCVGRLTAALEKGPNRDNTVVVFVSDHGIHLGEKSHFRKKTLWERTARVPLLVRQPGQTEGRRCRRVVQLVDLFPTLVDLCELGELDDLDGKSLAPLLVEPESPWDQAAVTTLRAGSHSVRTERWRYIRYQRGGEELYDHETDPNEWNNLAGDPATTEVVARLAGLLPENDAAPAPTR